MRTLKILLLPLLVLAVFAAVAPWFIGQNIQANTLPTLQNLLPPETRQQIQFTQQEFTPGWFSSTATVQARYNPLGLEEPLNVELDFDFTHGPLLITDSGLRLGLAHARILPSITEEAFSNALAELPFPPPAAYFDLLLYFDQALQLDFVVEPLNYSGNDGDFAFAGLHASLLANADLSANFSFNMGAFSISEPDNGLGFTINDMEITSYSEQLNDLMAPASARLSMQQISSAGPFPIAVDSLQAHSQLQRSAAAQEAIDISQSIALRDIEMELPLTSLQFDTELNEVPRSLIEGYYDLLEQMQTQINAGGGVTGDMGDLGEEIALIGLRNRLVSNNRLQSVAFQGEHQAELNLTWAGIPDIASLADLQPAAIVNALNLSLLIDLDESAINRSPAGQMIAPYARQGYVRIENGRILLQASLTNGELNLNGDIMPLNQFF